MSDTPRTDEAETILYRCSFSDHDQPLFDPLPAVPSKDARQLERELNAAKSILLEICFYAPNDSRYDRTGYSVWISPDTAIRDINYRDAELWPTAEEAVDAAIKFQMEQNK